MPVDVCFLVGARPNFMKVAPVLAGLGRLRPELTTLLVHTGQHYDSELSAVFLDELGLPDPDVFLGVGSGTHAEQTTRTQLGVEKALSDHSPRLLVVVGDVNSTLGGALAAARLNVPIAHVEAGLRSFDPTMQEEHNRRLTDHLSSVLLAHSASAVDNLAAEEIDRNLVYLVGNTMIDSLLKHVDAARADQPWLVHGLEPRHYGLVTLHRPSLVDNPDALREAVNALIALAEHVPLVFPVHPRTLERLRALDLVAQFEQSNVLLTAPLGYLAFLGLEAEAEFVLTDSGGVQEETSALGIPCFTLRDSTERPVTVELGTNTLLGLSPERLSEIPALLERPKRAEPIPLWDGEAGTRSAQVLARFLDVRD